MNPLNPNNKAGAITTLISAAFGTIGSIGPWVTLGSLSSSGTDGDGIITLICLVGSAILAGISLGSGYNRFGGIVFVLGLISAGVAIYYLAKIEDSSIEFFGESLDSSAGWGLWLVVAASFSTAIGGFLTAFHTESKTP